MLAPLVKELKFFKNRNMTNQDIYYLCREMTYENFNPGEAVLKYGDHGNKFFIIIKGTVDVKLPDTSGKKKAKNL